MECSFGHVSVCVSVFTFIHRRKRSSFIQQQPLPVVAHVVERQNPSPLPWIGGGHTMAQCQHGHIAACCWVVCVVIFFCAHALRIRSKPGRSKCSSARLLKETARSCTKKILPLCALRSRRMCNRPTDRSTDKHKKGVSSHASSRRFLSSETSTRVESSFHPALDAPNRTDNP